MLDGKRLWFRKIRHGKSASSPAVVGDDLVVHGMDGNVRVLDRSNGRVRWRFHIGSPVESSPVVSHGIDYFGAWNGNVYALDLRTRRLRWVFRSGYKITSSAALSGGKLFIGDYGGRIWALSPRSGHRRWVSSVGGRIYGTPAVAHGRVFVPSSTGNSLTAFSASGRHLWGINTGAYVYSSPAVWHGPRLLRVVQRRPLLRLGGERPHPLDVLERPRDLGRADRRRRRRLLLEHRPPHVRPQRAHGTRIDVVRRR